MKATWICPEGTSRNKNLYFQARSTFDLETPLLEAKLTLAAESLYMVWINGIFIGSGPARGSRSLNFYDQWNVVPWLHPGSNTIAVLVQCMNIPTFVASPHRAGLCAEIDQITWTGDDRWVVREANEEWRADVSLFCLQTGFMEWRDMRQEPVGWTTGNDTAIGWAKPEIIGSADSGMQKKLLPRPVPPLTRTIYLPSSIALVANSPATSDTAPSDVASLMTSEKLHPCDPQLHKQVECLTLGGEHEVVIQPPADGGNVIIIFGFDREIIGFFQIEISGPAGAVVDVGYDEELEGGRLVVLREHYRMVDRYVLPEGRSTVGTGLHERGFRFVEIALRNFTAPVILRKVTATDRRYPVSRRGQFRCSDPLLTEVWNICTETLSTCTTDVFTDCPWRERSFWVNDLLVENASWLQAFGDSRVNAHALTLALSNRREDGWLPGVCPDSGKTDIVLVPTNLFPPLILKDYLLHTGDAALVAKWLPSALGLIDLVESHCDAQHLVVPPESCWNFFDWSYELDKVNLKNKRTSLLEWLRCLALSDAAWLSEYLGDSGQAKRLRERIPPIAENTLRHFWADRSATCTDSIDFDASVHPHSSQLTHALALLSGTLPENRKAAAVDALNDSSLRIPELYLHFFVFRAMIASGMAQQAIDRIRQYWGPMVEAGTPTLWEAAVREKGKKAMYNAGSLCHGFGTAPIGVLQTALLGVDPIEPGFRVFSFSPQSCGLRFAAGTIPTPNGLIRVEWSLSNGAIQSHIDIPEGLTARLPNGKNCRAGHHEISFPIPDLQSKP
jgi:alpha-L-rhamnosidase